VEESAPTTRVQRSREGQKLAGCDPVRGGNTERLNNSATLSRAANIGKLGHEMAGDLLMQGH
jgi:hypothetical protein